MPHKTKQEKIIAEYRKRLKLFQEGQQPKQEVTVVPKEPATIPQKQIEREGEEDAVISSYFKKDFTKSLILIAIVITLEISLYFARINNYLR